MRSAPMVSAMNTQREWSPTWSPNAAPGLYTNVKRSQSPTTSRGTRSGISDRTASSFVATSLATMAIRIGQKVFQLSLRIFFALLALDAVAGVRKRIETLERNLLAAVVALAERLRRLVQPPQRLIDVPQEPAFLAREQECLLALHGVVPLIRHV